VREVSGVIKALKEESMFIPQGNSEGFRQDDGEYDEKFLCKKRIRMTGKTKESEEEEKMKVIIITGPDG
jgi:hypothetical protein